MSSFFSPTSGNSNPQTGPTTNDSSNNSWNSFWDMAKSQALELASKAQELAESASKIAQENANKIAKQATDLRENYDIEKARSILMNTVGSPFPDNVEPQSPSNYKLTKADLSKLDMVYVTENLIGMAHPRERADLIRSNGEGNDINVVAAYLKKKHQGRFMIWNISEEAYDYSKFGDQVLEYKFPGHPAPPLGLLFKICTSIESWLDADEKNVAVIHCLTGKGRTATLMACVLTWLGEFESPMQALQYVAQRRSTAVDILTIPSQRRYIQYFTNLLDGIKPNSDPLLLRRIIINTVPVFGKATEDSSSVGCCPYIQLFKNGKLITSTAPYIETASSDPLANIDQQMQLHWIKESDSSISFQVDCVVQGDILLRCRHAASSGARVSMFRAAFHTGYVSGGVLRLTKAQLDGTASDSRFSDDFFIDLIFAEKDSSQTEKQTKPEAMYSDKYEASIHRDARFWDSITERKSRSKKRKNRKFISDQTEVFSLLDDSKLLLDQDDMNEITFNTTGNSLETPNLSIPKKEFDDDELIKQLTQATEDSPSNTDNWSTSDQGTNSDGFTVIDKKANEPITPVTPTSSVVKNELDALEELEKELGLGDLNLFSAEKPKTPTASFSTPKSTPSGQNNTASVDDDNLDELEKYLESLSSN